MNPLMPREKKSNRKLALTSGLFMQLSIYLKKQYKEFNSILLIQHTKHNEVLYIER